MNIKPSKTLKSYIGLIFSLLLAFGVNAEAYETDQYTVPPSPLADVGEDLSLFIYNSLITATLQVQHEKSALPADIQKLQIELAHTPKSSPFPDDLERGVPPKMRQHKTQEQLAEEIKELSARLRLLQTEEGFVQVFKSRFAGRITWEEQRDAVFGINLTYLPYSDGVKQGRKILFDPGKTANVYSFAGFHRIISPTYFVFSSTLMAYNIYFGVDKIGHFFNQGFEYDEIYRKAMAQGKSQSQALKEAIASGTKAEDGIFGRLVDGVYSNADLAANFAGFNFYQNLFRPIVINGKILPAILEKNSEGNYMPTQQTRANKQTLLAPYISLHFNEALNPSVLERPMRAVVRGEVTDRCESFLRFYNQPSKEALHALRLSLQTWQGQDYGYKSENTLNLDELCFP